MRTRLAISLTELLVVMGIIAILVSMLLPTISLARAFAHSTVCLGKMRELGVASMVYVQDNRGLLYQAQVNYSHKGADWNIDPIWGMWPARIMPYLVKDYHPATAWNDDENWNRYFNCPASNWTVAELRAGYSSGVFTHGLSSAWTTSYGYNGGVWNATGSLTTPSNVLKPDPDGSLGLTVTYRMIRIANARTSSTIMLSEKWGVMEVTGRPDDRSGVNPPGTPMHQRPIPASWPRQAAPPAGSNSACLRQSHRGRSSYLFLDGHVALHAVGETWNGSSHTAGSWWFGN